MVNNKAGYTATPPRVAPSRLKSESVLSVHRSVRGSTDGRTHHYDVIYAELE